MGKITDIKPVRVIYALDDIFNAVSARVEALTEKLSQLAQDTKDNTIVHAVASSELSQRKHLLTIIEDWKKQGVQYLETDRCLSDTATLTQDPSASLDAQMATGHMRPLGSKGFCRCKV